MIEPACSGQALLDEIRDTHPGPGALAIWWLGQSGYVVKSAGATLVIDPYLSEHLTTKYAGTSREHVRMTRAPFRGADLAGVDLVLVSHKHSDHFDPGTIPDLLAASPGATIVLPASLLGHSANLGIAPERLRGIVAGEPASFPPLAKGGLGVDSAQPGTLARDPLSPTQRAVPPGPPPLTPPSQGGEIGRGDGTTEATILTVHAIPSAHEGLDTDDAGRHLYLGYIVEVEGLRLYHSGDCVVYDGLAQAIGPERLDVMFLPINGRDPARGVPGNMTAAEAVDLAITLRPRFVVPHHYDMFTFNTVPVGVFETEAKRLASGVSPKVLRVGERWEISR